MSANCSCSKMNFLLLLMMLLQKWLSALKKRGLSILFYALLIIFIVSPSAKSWLLEQLISIGLFNASIGKTESLNKISANIDFTYLDGEGNKLTIASLKGKIVIINFWASWCPPCRAEMPSLEGLYKKLRGDDRFVFLFINEDENKTKSAVYLDKNNFIIPVYSRSGEISSAVFSGTLPTTIVLDKSLKVVFKYEGMAGYNTDKFIQQLKELL